MKSYSLVNMLVGLIKSPNGPNIVSILFPDKQEKN